MSSYGFGVALDGDIATIRPQVEAALKAQGFGILTEIRPNQPVARLRQLDMFGNRPTKLPQRCALYRGFNLHAGVRVG